MPPHPTLHTEVLLTSLLLSFSKPDMSRLRLAAGSAIVKLAQEPCYHEIITLEQYQLCALAINVRAVAHGVVIVCSWAQEEIAAVASEPGMFS